MRESVKIKHEQWYDQGVLIDDFYSISTPNVGHKEFSTLEKALKFCEDNNLEGIVI